MRALTDTLRSIMTVVSHQMELLPASEGAIEELTFTDEEELAEAHRRLEELGYFK